MKVPVPQPEQQQEKGALPSTPPLLRKGVSQNDCPERPCSCVFKLLSESAGPELPGELTKMKISGSLNIHS